MKHTFRYCSTHKADEAYMQQMCSRGWAAERLVEGFWTFRECEKGQYCFRVCYLRGKSKAEVEALKREYAARGIQFVSRYSFWAIFRSPEPFCLYSPRQELAICRQIYAPMPIGAGISWLLFLLGLLGSLFLSPWLWILTLAAGLYGAMCTWLGLSYRRLLRQLSAS